MEKDSDCDNDELVYPNVGLTEESNEENSLDKCILYILVNIPHICCREGKYKSGAYMHIITQSIKFIKVCSIIKTLGRRATFSWNCDKYFFVTISWKFSNVSHTVKTPRLFLLGAYITAGLYTGQHLCQ